MRTTADNDLIEAFIRDMMHNGGPDPDDYDHILEIIDRLSAGEIESLRKLMEPILNPGTIIGFSFCKPFGYNGDFFIIEKIYQHFISPDPRYRKWDQFFHRLPAAIAVVNRKKLAIEMLKELNEASSGRTLNVLILGSGPVTEVNEYLKETPENKLAFDLIDLDQRAIDYAKQKNKAFMHCLNFQHKNVIRFTPEKKYDLIWSAGLFDYFKDKHFVFLLKRYYEFIIAGGKMVIGNFNTENPSRKIMEVLGDWFLYHRSEEELQHFAEQAGIPQSAATVISEPLGINLFLVVRKER
ncbi:MAG: class I SAM-dependent methyltransferase [Bacteroidales bacterium]|nr:class I SAM-dependent methyltransferase [Bacteroidales bacterium]